MSTTVEKIKQIEDEVRVEIYNAILARQNAGLTDYSDGTDAEE